MRTAVWIDHLRVGDAELASLLERGVVLAHPWVTGELALASSESSRRPCSSTISRRRRSPRRPSCGCSSRATSC